jgi:hypothetical protein
MSITPFAPAAPYRRLMPQEPQNFSTENDRVRLSAAALTAYRSLSAIWNLTGAEAAALMAVSPSTWDRMKKPDWAGALNQDQLTRVSSLVGIFKGLHLLFADGLADEWPKLPNKGALFDGDTPVAGMVEGGIPRMLDVRRHVDALRGGL